MHSPKLVPYTLVLWISTDIRDIHDIVDIHYVSCWSSLSSSRRALASAMASERVAFWLCS